MNLAVAFIAIGPTGTCARAPGSVNCCSQSLGSILVPWPSYLTYPSWWNSLAIRLGPVGCVLPAAKVVEFVVPKVYLGQNPVDGITNALTQQLPGFIQIDARISTTPEPHPQLCQRRSELWPLVWSRDQPYVDPIQLLGNLPQAALGHAQTTIAGGALGVPGTAVPPGNPTPGSFPKTWITTDEAPGLASIISMLDAVRAGGYGSWVVGLGTFVAVRFEINTNVAGSQPTTLNAFVTLRNSLVPIGSISGNLDVTDVLPAAGVQPTTFVTKQNTDYYFAITGSSGVFRHNVGSLDKMINILSATPAACGNNLNAFSSALGTVFVAVRDTGCINAMTANTVIIIPIPNDFLLPNPSAGTFAFFDIRLIPSMRQGFLAPRQTLDILPLGLAVANAPCPPNAANPNAVAANIINGRCNNVFDNRFPGGIATDAQQTDTAATMWVLGYVTVADCRFLPYVPGAVTDIATATTAARCAIVNSMAMLSPTAFGFKQCNEGASINTAQNLVTFYKYPESVATSVMWPYSNVAAISTWPQNVGLPGTWPIYIYSWGYMFSQPMFGIVVTYPATATNLKALGAAPTVNSAWTLGFLVKMDRITSACSVNLVEENPWTFCVVTTQSVVQMLHFPTAPVTAAGVPLNAYNQYTGWTRSSSGACATVLTDGAVAGWYTTAVSPAPGDGSDAAWYAFFAFFALPLLLLCCCLLWALWYFRKRPEPVYVPEYPVQEMYWVNAQPAAPVYSMEPAVPMMQLAPQPTPIYLQ